MIVQLDYLKIKTKRTLKKEDTSYTSTSSGCGLISRGGRAVSSLFRKKSTKLMSTPRSKGFEYAPVESFKYPYLDLLIISLVVRFFAIK